MRALLLAGRRHAVELDAQDTLGLFTRDGQPDRELFEQTVGAVVRRLAVAGRPLHAYGEMVALLWAQGAVRAALELEALWNGLQREVTFSLLCAYPGPHLRPPHRTGRLSGGNRTGTYASHPGADLRGGPASEQRPPRCRKVLHTFLIRLGPGMSEVGSTVLVWQSGSRFLLRCGTSGR